jgi:hypothetical protein
MVKEFHIRLQAFPEQVFAVRAKTLKQAAKK